MEKSGSFHAVDARLKVVVKRTMKIQRDVFWLTIRVRLQVCSLLKGEICKHHKGVEATPALARDFLLDASERIKENRRVTNHRYSDDLHTDPVWPYIYQQILELNSNDTLNCLILQPPKDIFPHFGWNTEFRTRTRTGIFWQTSTKPMCLGPRSRSESRWPTEVESLHSEGGLRLPDLTQCSWQTLPGPGGADGIWWVAELRFSAVGVPSSSVVLPAGDAPTRTVTLTGNLELPPDGNFRPLGGSWKAENGKLTSFPFLGSDFLALQQEVTVHQWPQSPSCSCFVLFCFYQLWGTKFQHQSIIATLKFPPLNLNRGRFTDPS